MTMKIQAARRGRWRVASPPDGPVDRCKQSCTREVQDQLASWHHEREQDRGQQRGGQNQLGHARDEFWDGERSMLVTGLAEWMLSSIQTEYHMLSPTASISEQSRYSSATPSQSLSTASQISSASGPTTALSSLQSPSVA